MMTPGITLSLVSHTNIGKTTLARTLLRREVGEVLDQAHVTDRAERFELIRSGNEVLWLWDTPGFGDSVRLIQRLRAESNPIRWFVQQSWDRFRHRALWSSQQAALNVRRESDLVLYLVNASEAPMEAGYLPSELELLEWMEKPIIVVLNQTGSRAPVPEAEIHSWKRFLESWPLVKDVVALDAFSRCWVQEGLLFETLVDHLEGDSRDRMRRLKLAWDRRNRQLFLRSIEHLSSYLLEATRDRETIASRRMTKAEKRTAMEQLAARLEASTSRLMNSLLADHDLDGEAKGELERQVDAFIVAGEEVVDPKRGAVVGSVVSGALGGLAADVLSGGLSLGGGLIAGAILGALGGAGLAKGYQSVRGSQNPEIRWSDDFLEHLAIQAMLRYLAVAHFGRGRGAFEDLSIASFWMDRVGPNVRNQKQWRLEFQQRENAAFGELVRGTIEAVLTEAYPGAEQVLSSEDSDEGGIGNPDPAQQSESSTK